VNKASVELIYVLAAMLVLFLFGVAVVAAFWRVWLRERRGRDDARRGDEPPSDGSRPQ
jgi:hypothetical protein